ncbi:cytochrome c oxidase assembly protein COX19 [Choiromyces venosus 120613-1]|uniref:Cytochrome c oxidase assembly protein COX19 n=1 Tax=Choiromyces venosus 120613-1 TaxID=1336337 RepID=A0A3N4JM43_9PEZI|nr:cytochrome c oxidase assembly protein COX19 [Choiromyces venosus 120613-1]
MSGFGRPPSTIIFSPTPPERGSFPLDHDGECKPVMQDYLACLKKAKGTNADECRILAKAYLKCRMDHNLMAQDEFRNLGFQDEGKKEAEKVGTGGSGSRLEELKRENEELKKRNARGR